MKHAAIYASVHTTPLPLLDELQKRLGDILSSKDEGLHIRPIGPGNPILKKSAVYDKPKGPNLERFIRRDCKEVLGVMNDRSYSTMKAFCSTG